MEPNKMMNIFNEYLLKHRERIVGLDIMRSVAILTVVYAHSAMLVPEKYRSIYWKLNFLKFDGVSIFFVLSGFLIGGILLKTIRKTDFTLKDLMNFWIRRWFRTIPNYLFVLITVVCLSYLFSGGFGDFNLKYFLFLQNFSSPHPGFFAEAWSLTIEEWFYLLFPLSCYVFHKMLKNKTKSVLLSAIVFLFVPLIIRIVKFELGIGTHDLDGEFRKIVIVRLDSLMFGIFGVYLQFSRPAIWNKLRYHLLLAGIFLVIMLNINPLNWKYYYYPLNFNIEAITTFCFLPFLSGLRTTRVKIFDVVFIFISIISYSMYLLNLSVVNFNLIPPIRSILLKTNLPLATSGYTYYLLYWFLVIFGSFLLYRYFENPMTKLREKFSLK